MNTAREKFNFVPFDYEMEQNNLQGKKATTTPIEVIKGLLEEMKTNAYVGSAADTSSIPIPTRGTLITPQPFEELGDVIYEVGQICAYSGCSFSCFTARNFSSFNGAGVFSANVSGFNSSNVSGFNSSNHSGFNSASFKASSFRGSSFRTSTNSTHMATHRSGNFANVSSFFSSNHASFSFNSSYSCGSGFRSDRSNSSNFSSFHGTFRASSFDSSHRGGFQSSRRSDSSRSFSFTGSYRSYNKEKKGKK